MFTPDLDLKVITRCSKFGIQDKTGVDTGDGDKWSGVSGLDPSTLTSAVIRIVAPSGAYSDTDVLDQIPSPVTGTWWFDDMTGTSEDGLHNLVYKLQTTSINISAYADYSATVSGTTQVTSTGHALVTGMYIEIDDSVSYNGEYMVTKIDDNNFYITADFVATEADTTATKMFLSTFYPYVYCASEAGIQKMFANLSRMTHGERRRKYQDDANTAMGLLNALKSAITPSNLTALTAIQAEIDQILSFNNVDANI